MNQTQQPNQLFLDTNGVALEDGYIYIGTVDLNPETNPIAIYYDEAATEPAAQPLRTSAGYIWKNGSPARIYVSADTYSITVKDRHSRLISYVPSADTQFTAAGILTQTATGQFYENLGAKVNRLNDRLFVGDATINDGDAWTGTGSGDQDYVSQNIPQGPTTALSQFASLSSVGGIGGMFGTRTSDGVGAATQDELAIVGVAINDYTTTPVIAEAAYFEAQRKANAGTTTGVEIDTVNQGAVVEWTPYKSLFSASTGYTFGASIAAGGARTGVSDSSAALNIVNNGANFGKGIVFYSASLDSSNEAIVFAQDHKIKWYSGSQQNFATAAASTLGSYVINFTATAVLPYVGMVIVPSDGITTFAANTYVTIVNSATQVTVSTAALAATAGLTIAGLIGFPTNSIYSSSTNTQQDSIVFSNTGTMLGFSPSTDSGLNCAGALQVVGATNGTNYVTVTASSGGAPLIATNGGALTVTSNTGLINFAASDRYVRVNYSVAGSPTVDTNAGSLFLSSATGAVYIGNTEALPTALATTTQVIVNPTTATPAGGSVNTGLCFGTTTNLGIFYGSGVPTLAAAQGSLYMRTDGSSTSTRMYINTDGSTGWTNVTTAA